jgi:hypothetical protein
VALARRLPVRSSNEKPRGETPGAFFFGRGGLPPLQGLSVVSSLRSWRMHSCAIFLLSRKVCIGVSSGGVEERPFLAGFRGEAGLIGRPVDVSDDCAGVVYRVSPPRSPTPGG